MKRTRRSIFIGLILLAGVSLIFIYCSGDEGGTNGGNGKTTDLSFKGTWQGAIGEASGFITANEDMVEADFRGQTVFGHTITEVVTVDLNNRPKPIPLEIGELTVNKESGPSVMAMIFGQLTAEDKVTFSGSLDMEGGDRVTFEGSYDGLTILGSWLAKLGGLDSSGSFGAFNVTRQHEDDDPTACLPEGADPTVLNDCDAITVGDGTFGACCRHSGDCLGSQGQLPCSLRRCKCDTCVGVTPGNGQFGAPCEKNSQCQGFCEQESCLCVDFL